MGVGVIETGYLPNPEGWHLWTDVIALIDTAARRGGCEPWVEGDLLWIAIDGGAVIGAATTRLLTNGNAELKHVAGVRGREWFGRLDAQIEEWARANGCRLAVSRGRKGWRPIVEKWGWRVVGQEDGLTLYEKVL